MSWDGSNMLGKKKVNNVLIVQATSTFLNLLKVNNKPEGFSVSSTFFSNRELQFGWENNLLP